MTAHPPPPTLFPYTTLFRSNRVVEAAVMQARSAVMAGRTLADPLRSTPVFPPMVVHMINVGENTGGKTRSEEHTSELQSRSDLVCRLLLEKKKTKTTCYDSS